MSNPTTPQIFQDLKSTIKADDINKVRTLLTQWSNDPTTPGPTPSDLNYLISCAAEGPGHPAILEYLFSLQGAPSPADIDAYTLGQTTSPEIFKLFIQKGWKVTQGVLHSHIQYPELVALFLANGAEANNPDVSSSSSSSSSSGARSGYQPIETAALRAPLESVHLLLDHGAHLGPGKTRALNAAARGDVPDRIPIMALLLEHSAAAAAAASVSGPDSNYNNDDNIINALAEDYPAPYEARRSGRRGTPLHSAAKWGNREMVDWLLEHGADPEVRNEAGETADEWGKRFERGGAEAGLRIRRDILRKNRRVKKEEEGQGGSGEALGRE